MVNYELSATIANNVKYTQAERDALQDRVQEEVNLALKKDGWDDVTVTIVLSCSRRSIGCQSFSREDGGRYDLKLCAAVYRLTTMYLKQAMREDRSRRRKA